jgi:DNA-binding CsgD family transcriptional regulator
VPTKDSRSPINSPEAPRLQKTRHELGLTPRERQILSWVAHGKTNGEIAAVLWVAPSTVRKHLENIYAKLGVHTRTAAVMRYLSVLDDEGRQALMLG